MRFEEQVNQIQDLRGSFHPGLGAFGSNREKIHPQDPRACCGSVNLDDNLRRRFPNDPRWDYCICYTKRNYFVEIHPAYTSEVDLVLRKLEWLKQWLRTDGKPLWKGIAPEKPFHWIFTKRCAVKPGDRYARKLAKAGLWPLKDRLRLPIK
ncbi:MAG: hypothetical protein D6765_04785 [Bacteroidetes bacterium]|nr:MAG: hypothetical protein D6765_04785 [Bacteroidota bacterium]